jgi:hypothetical protein
MTMSFDCIGPLTNSAEDSKLIFDIIKVKTILIKQQGKKTQNGKRKGLSE